MKQALTLLSLLFSVFLAWGANEATKTKLTDEEIRSKLIGEWTAVIIKSDGTRTEGENDYRADGTIITRGAKYYGNEVLFAFEASGIWNVGNGVITITAKESSRPDIIPVGDVSTMEVISIDDKELRYKLDGDKIGVRKRKAAKPESKKPPST